MKVVLMAILLSARATMGFSSFEGTTMNQRELELFQDVIKTCRLEVDRYCSDSAYYSKVFPATRNNMESTSDRSNFDLAMPSLLEEMDSFSRMMDHLMDDVLDLPPCVKTSPITSTLLIFPMPQEEEEQEDSMQVHRYAHVEAADRIVTRIAASTADPQDLPFLSERVQEHSNALMQNDQASLDKRRLARRLTEVATPEAFQAVHQQQHTKVFLPFDESSNKCLLKLYHQERLSKPCTQALKSLGSYRSIYSFVTESMHHSYGSPDTVFIYMGVVYFLAMATILAVVWKRPKRHGKQLTQVRSEILRAIYSRPELKAAIERELKETLGSTPPYEDLHTPMVQQKKSWSDLLGRLYYCLLIVGVVLSGIVPDIMMPIWVIISFATLVKTVTKIHPSEQVSTCCCCGVSTNDAAAENLLLLQDGKVVCDCCHGTGICSVQCSGCGPDKAAGMLENSCCSSIKAEDGPDGNANDAGANANMEDITPLELETSRLVIYHGVPVQIV